MSRSFLRLLRGKPLTGAALLTFATAPVCCESADAHCFLPQLSNQKQSEMATVIESRPNALHIASESGDMRKCVELLESGDFDINEKDSDGETAVLKAARAGRLRLVEKLIAFGANLEISDKEGWTPLHWAAQEGCMSLVGVLLDRCPILINTRDKRGLSALHVAAWQGDAEMVSRLLSEGADFKEVTFWGETPLHHATYFGHEKVCEILLKAGSDPNVDDKMKRSPASIVKERNDILLTNIFSEFSTIQSSC